MDRLQIVRARLAELFLSIERRSLAFAVSVGAARAFLQDNCPLLAAAIAYYALFSLFPLLLGLIAIGSLLLASAEVQQAIITAASSVLPASEPLVQRNIEQIMEGRGTVGLVAIVTLLWSAKAIFGAITTSLNIVWDVREKRSFWKLTAIQLGLVFGAGFFFASSLALTAFIALISRAPLPLIGVQLADIPFWPLIVEPFSLALNTTAFLLFYRFLPNASLRIKDVWQGALVAGILFEIAKNGYVFYTTSFTNYVVVYGSIAAVIILLLWAWVSSAILLFGAEIAAENARLKR